jgi:putative PIN family toxin of toxin-antitoxin system
MKVVLDTNVLFAAFAARSGLCGQIVENVLTDHDLFISQHILDELIRHLRGKLGLDQLQINHAIESLLDLAIIVEPAPISPDAVRDPQDAPILGTAVACGADVLVSGDKDLLVLGYFQSFEILPPRTFYDRFVMIPP